MPGIKYFDPLTQKSVEEMKRKRTKERRKSQTLIFHG